MPGPLDGIRILELGDCGADGIATPWACQILGDMGADVIKVETPEGDSARRAGPRRNAQSPAASYLTLNRNKRSLAIDIHKKSSHAILRKLAEGVDVLVHSRPPAIMTELGLDYPTLKAAAPRLVWCNIPAYGGRGPYGARTANEAEMQAATGLALLNQQALARDPCYAPTLICEKTAALAAVSAVIAALFHRIKSGHGQRVEVPIFETMAGYLMIEHMWGQSFVPPVAKTGYPGVLSPYRKLTPSKDGYISILAYMHWDTFCRIGERPELIDDPRFKTLPDRMANIDALYAETTKVMATRTTQAWLDAFSETSVPITAVNSLADLLDDPHLQATGFWKTVNHPSAGKMRLPAFPVNYSETPAEIRRPAPELGAHGTEILEEAGVR